MSSAFRWNMEERWNNSKAAISRPKPERRISSKKLCWVNQNFQGMNLNLNNSIFLFGRQHRKESKSCIIQSSKSNVGRLQRWNICWWIHESTSKFVPIKILLVFELIQVSSYIISVSRAHTNKVIWTFSMECPNMATLSFSHFTDMTEFFHFHSLCLSSVLMLQACWLCLIGAIRVTFLGFSH